MANIETRIPVTRVPNLPSGKMVDANGMPTDDELSFRQTLISLLQSLFGEQGLVVPTQTKANIDTIQSNDAQAQGASPAVYKTCQFGTILYNSSPYDAITNPGGNSIMVAVDDGTGAPLFKVVTLT
jgi:hypothetical protein